MSAAPPPHTRNPHAGLRWLTARRWRLVAGALLVVAIVVRAALPFALTRLVESSGTGYLGRVVRVADVAVQTDRRPTPGEMLRLLTSHARIPLEEIAPHPSGKVFDASSAVVEPAADGGGGRLQVAPESIAAELREVAAEPLVAGAGYRPGEEFTHRLISRRMDEVNNSSGSEIPSLRARHRFNPAYMNPADLDALGLGSGARIEIRSDYGHLPAIAEATPDVPPGVISMAHGWGDLPERDDEVAEIGSCVGRLIDTTRDYDPISGIHRQSAIPVNVRALGR